jgi:(2R)-sulfolactate sulfo-lyase subunit alpha
MEETVPKAPDFLVHEVEDTVGVVVVEEAGKGKTLEGWLMAKDSTLKLKSKDSIPLGHKVALNNIKKGDTIIKYGHDIGKAIADIAKGGHVHVHNVKTKRW